MGRVNPEHIVYGKAGAASVEVYDMPKERAASKELLDESEQRLRRGVHPRVVAELLGHSTVTMTLNRYLYVLPDMQQAAREAMDGLLG